MPKLMTWLPGAASFCLLLCTGGAQAEGHGLPAIHRPAKTVEVLMLSDLHFDPLSDPEKFKQLRAAPAEGWQAILDEPASTGRTEAFAAVQQKCKARGIDSSWSLLRNSLQSAKLRAPNAAFVTVGGDLLVHGLDCRIRAVAAETTDDEISTFSEKTIAFVAQQMHRLFPGTPVYLALGNNDSGCADYRETPGSAFLKGVGQSFAADVPAGVTGKAGDGDAFGSFSEYGSYSVRLPAPMQNTRLLVLQDIFLSERYATCGGKKLLTPDVAENDWLRGELEKAKAAKEHVWVMAHIPPGVDVYSSFHRYVFEPAKLCDVKTPTMFLHSDAMTETLASFPEVVQLAVFSHTHMDEVKLLHRGGAAASEEGVAAKLIPSISPINGNRPAFVVGQVSTATGGLIDYSTYTSGDMEGTHWMKSYSFRSAYGLEDFSARSVSKLTADLRADRTGAATTSRTYRQWFLPGDSGLIGLGLQQIWPAYSCSASETSPADFNRCLCPAHPEKTAAAESNAQGK